MRITLAILVCGLCSLVSCNKEKTAEPPVSSPTSDINYRSEMRQFVIGLANYARQFDSDFIVIPQNGQALATLSDDHNSSIQMDYLNAIDGQGREELYFGFDNNDDVATPADETDFWLPHLEIMRNQGVQILCTDYCETPSNVDASYALNANKSFLSFAADSRELNTIPSYPNPIPGENNSIVTSLANAYNFLYLINTDQYADKASFIAAVAQTNYDVIIMDAYFEEFSYTNDEIEALRQKANGGKRLVIAYMSIGEAEDYRPYWNSTWSFEPPTWLGSINPDWPGNFKVNYWDPEWQSIIFGNEISYTKYLVNAGFDGTYLDIIDAYEYWEER